jgi:pantothenate kinase type III
VFAINGIIKKITKEKNFKPRIILTGGLAKIFKNDIKPKPIINTNLTLEGLQVIGSLYYAKKKY